VTLQPGLYVGGIEVSGTAHITLAPGLYYLEGGLSVSGSATVTDGGKGVLLYLTSNSGTGDRDDRDGGAGLSVRGHGQLNLTGLSADQLTALGLTDPRYVGLAIFQGRGNPGPWIVSGQGSINVTGTVYAAAARVEVTGRAALNLEGDATKKFASHLLVAALEVEGKGSVSVDASNNNLELL
jgi:hypothetical protein